MSKYAVICCFPGCLPENEPVEFTSLRAAKSYAYSEAIGYRESHDAATMTGRDGDYTVYYMYGTYRVYVTAI